MGFAALNPSYNPWRCSIRLVARCLDQPRPTLALPADILGQLRSGLARHVEALRVELAAHIRISMRGLSGCEQALDDRRRRAGAHGQSEPDTSGELGIAELREGRHIWHIARARIISDRDCTNLSITQERQRRLR